MKAMTLQRLRRRLWMRSGIALAMLAVVFYFASTWVLVYHFPSGKGFLSSYEGSIIARRHPSFALTSTTYPLDRIQIWRDRGAIAYLPQMQFRAADDWSVRLPWTNVIAAVAVATALWCLRTHRRGLRLLRAGCKQCGYDITDLPQCPECGTART
ncbi:MAG TPA: hypothetical protein VK157_08855 [Phycisphaerales bacterium]|nr:hypothetical protein [Phycisphaerales bacterium]